MIAIAARQSPIRDHARKALTTPVLGKEVICKDRGKSYDRTVGECTVGKIQVGPYMLTHGWAVAYETFLKKREKPFYIGPSPAPSEPTRGYGL